MEVGSMIPGDPDHSMSEDGSGCYTPHTHYSSTLGGAATQSSSSHSSKGDTSCVSRAKDFLKMETKRSKWMNGWMEDKDSVHNYAQIWFPCTTSVTCMQSLRCGNKNKNKKRRNTINYKNHFNFSNDYKIVYIHPCISTLAGHSSRNRPTSDVRPQFVVVSIQQAIKNVRHVTLIHFWC